MACGKVLSAPVEDAGPKQGEPAWLCSKWHSVLAGTHAELVAVLQSTGRHANDSVRSLLHQGAVCCIRE